MIEFKIHIAITDITSLHGSMFMAHTTIILDIFLSDQLYEISIILKVIINNICLYIYISSFVILKIVNL